MIFSIDLEVKNYEPANIIIIIIIIMVTSQDIEHHTWKESVHNV